MQANLGFLKVLVAKLPSKVLQVHMKSMVEDLLNCQVYCETPLKAKVKLLLEMLVKKCGLDDIRAVMPQEQMELLADLQTIMERQEERILGCISVKARSNMSEASTFRLSRWNHTEIFSDFDEETVDSNADYMDVDKVSGRCGKTSSRLKSKSLLRPKSRKTKRSWEKTAALDKKNQLRERVKLELDRASERGLNVVRPMAPDSFTRMVAKLAATGAISGAVEVTNKLRIEV